MKHLKRLMVLPFLLLMVQAVSAQDGPVVVDDAFRFDAGTTRLTVHSNGGMQVDLLGSGETHTLSTASENAGEWTFDLTQSIEQSEDGYWVLKATSASHPVTTLSYLMRKDVVSGAGIELRTIITNGSSEPTLLPGFTLFEGQIDASRGEPDRRPSDFWAFVGGSYEARFDWLEPIDENFARENDQAMNAPDYGGGIPALDVWNEKGGLFVGSISMSWRPLAFPVRGSASGVETRVYRTLPVTIESGASWEAAPLYILAHAGDAYNGLHPYGRVLETHGMNFPTPPASTFDPMWCAWGYERGFNMDEVIGTLPKAAELGYKWAGLDDGFQTANGDWDIILSRFPDGEAGIKAFADKVHSYGMKAMLWWVPGDAGPKSNVAKDHPDWVVKNEDGSPATISWWDTWYLDPANPAVLEHQKMLAERFIGDWGFDALKTDGQCFNQVPPDYGNHPDDPYTSTRHSDDILKAVYEGAKAANPDAVLHNCPCGCVFSLYNMPWTDQYVSSDPHSSWQIRNKGLVLRAIVGDKISYSSDHIELSTGGDDFATAIGIGSVPSTKFIWPEQPERELSGDFLLTPEREQMHRHWLKIYEENRLSQATYRNLYVMGYDPVEAYVFEKNGTMYYSFYADSYAGPLDLRGLEPGMSYSVVDYDRDESYGSVTGPTATIEVSFTHHLLLRATAK